jgi:ubiquinone/menaquinone biosynthesis C-methylase UbiE
MRVADIGAGSGAYALAAGMIVGTTGSVYTIDIQTELLARIRKEAEDRRLRNIETISGDAAMPGGTKLADASVDAVILSNALFQAEHELAMVVEARRILKPAGKLLLVEWSDSFGHIGPHPDHVFSAETAKELFSASGFSLEREFEAGVHHYGMIFKKLEQ